MMSIWGKGEDRDLELANRNQAEWHTKHLPYRAYFKHYFDYLKSFHKFWRKVRCDMHDKWSLVGMVKNLIPLTFSLSVYIDLYLGVTSVYTQMLPLIC